MAERTRPRHPVRGLDVPGLTEAEARERRRRALDELDPEARSFGELAAHALGCGPGAYPIVTRWYAEDYQRTGVVTAIRDLRTKLAFDQAWEAWRAAAHELAAAGARHFEERWPEVASDLESNAVRLYDPD